MTGSRVGDVHPDSRERRGFALLAVLWTIVGMSALALVGGLAARSALSAAVNRRALAVARWRAEGCLEEARATIDAALEAEQDGRSHTAPAWPRLDQLIVAAFVSARGDEGSVCNVAARAAGDAVDVNDADGDQLRALFVALGVSAKRADSLADALLDWRDADDVPRPVGAERAWYATTAHAPPRNAAVADVRELSLVRGFEGGVVDGVSLDSLFTAEPGRIMLDRAPLAVAASLPGFTAEAVARLAERRLRGVPSGDLLAFSGSLSRAARDSLVARYPDLVRLTAPEPDAWIVTAVAHSGEPAVTASVELRLVRAGSRAAVVRRRSTQ